MLKYALICFAFAATCSPSKASDYVCPVKECATKESTEVGRWECFGRRLFRPVEAGGNGRIVEHQCDHAGWGSGLHSISIAAQLASMLDARLVFQRQFGHLWTVPGGFEISADRQKEKWDFEAHGRTDRKFRNWYSNLIEYSDNIQKYDNKSIAPSICGLSAHIVRSAPCTTEALTHFGKCIDKVHDHGLNMPVFFSLFRNPTALMVRHLSEIRKRLALPQLAPGFEPSPGAWGLHTPGYYILALHFRMIPLGFEPLSVMLNEPGHLLPRRATLAKFWDRAEKAAKDAAALAACRNETLLIYFATDDPEGLREEAVTRLRGHGRVVFGLAEDEVGHNAPHWTPQAESSVDTKMAAVRKKADGTGAGADAKQCPSKRRAADAAAGGGSPPTLANPARDAEATRRHADMAMVEWWVLASAQWLVTEGTSSFAVTAGAWGLGPGGRMERMDSGPHATFRIHWDRDDCPPAGAANPAQEEECPNRKPR